MRRMLIAVSLGLAAAAGTVMLPERAEASCAAPPTINGEWRGDDGGTYVVRTVGNVVWWIGRSSDGGTTWQNVFRGIRNGNLITGSWADVGSAVQNAGTMTVRIRNTAALERVSETGGFGGGRWSRRCGD